MLGIPTVADRVAQMVAKIYFEPCVEPYLDAVVHCHSKTAAE
ncbi:RNA-directed DNA polymerase [Paenibacillus sp. FSL H8-237]|nr:RNA-directed DNA polymerase [Paenibacillus sp. FSL H8-237]